MQWQGEMAKSNQAEVQGWSLQSCRQVRTGRDFLGYVPT